MKRRFAFMLAIILAVAVGLTGCGASGGVKSGATKMRAALTEVRQAVEAGDQAKANTKAAALEDAWAKFEDELKAKDKKLYSDIEDPLSAIKGGTKSGPLDQKLLGEQVKALDALLEPLTK